MAVGGKFAIGGGAGGLIVLVLALLLGGDPGSLLGGLTGTTDSVQLGIRRRPRRDARPARTPTAT